MYSELNGLLIRAKEGDRNSKEEIVNRLQGLIIKSIQRYYNKMDEYEDLIQEGNLVILEAIDDYDSSRVKYLAYLVSLAPLGILFSFASSPSSLVSFSPNVCVCKVCICWLKPTRSLPSTPYSL